MTNSWLCSRMSLRLFRQRCLSLLSFLWMFFTLALQAQTDQTRIYGPLDRDVKTPKASGTFGQVDAAASSEVSSHRYVMGASEWQGMTGTGQISYPNANTPVIADATFTILNTDDFRLDVTTTKGIQSTRIHGTYGAIRNTDGSMRFYMPTTAQQGLVGFPLFLKTSFPNQATSMFDKGLVMIDGIQLHRITVERPVNAAAPPAASMLMREKLLQDVITDYYFDPATHLLHKSVAIIQIPGSTNQLLECISYGDYQRVQGEMVPFLYRKTLNGQLQWTLQLNQVQLNPNLPRSYFIFRNNSQ